MADVRVKAYSTFESSISFLFGKTPKVSMLCGSCSFQFSKRFSPIDFKNGHPHAMCPKCHTVNYVPISVR